MHSLNGQFGISLHLASTKSQVNFNLLNWLNKISSSYELDWIQLKWNAEFDFVKMLFDESNLNIK